MFKNACIIDDDDIFRFIMKTNMSKLEIAENVTAFENGKIAMDFFLENTENLSALPDVVFLDINMPEMNGWEFITAFEKIVGELPKKVSIIMVSSSLDKRDLERAESTNCIHGYVTKPIDKSKMTRLKTGMPSMIQAATTPHPSYFLLS